MSISKLHAFATAAITAAVCFLGLVGPASATYSGELKRYPYLTDVVGNSATVNWGTTRLSISGGLRYGQVGTESCTAHTATSTKTAITVGTVSQYQWKARLSNLSPDTEYCYRPYLGTNPEIDLLGSDLSPRFKSQLPTGASTPFSFAVFGDWGAVGADGTNPDQANLMQRIAASGARFALTTGDNAYPSGSQLNYGDLVQTGADTSAVFGPSFWTVAGASMALFPAMGNHGFSGATGHLTSWPQDVAAASSNGRYLRETHCCLNGTTSGEYPSTWYAFDAGNARFYVLEAAWTSTNAGTSDQYGDDYAYHWTPTSAQYKWLQSDLATHPRPLKFAFFHYPLYSDNASENSDTYLQGANGLEGLLGRYGVDAAFSGHAHIYQRNSSSGANGLLNYVTGGGGADLQPIGARGCSSLDAFGIGWSNSSSVGSACGGAPVPSSKSQLFHFLLVSVGSSGVTITPTDEQGRTFDSLSIPRSASNADLSLTSFDSPDPALRGQTVTYSLTARNNGPSAARGVVVADDLPAGVTYDSATPSQGSCSEAGGTVSCNLENLASGASASVAVRVRSSDTGTITNTAVVVGDDLVDPNQGNNSTSATTTINDGADLAITKSGSPGTVLVGETITYTLSVTNNGVLDATNVVVTDPLPSNATYQSATPSQGSCSLAAGTVSCGLDTVANGGNATVTIKVAPTKVGNLTNSASVSANEIDPASSNNSASDATKVKKK